MPPGSSLASAASPETICKRGTLARACFGDGQGAGIEVEGTQGAPSIGGGAALLPVQTPGNHQVEDQPEIVVEADGNPFTDAPQTNDVAAMGGCQRRIGGT